MPVRALPPRSQLAEVPDVKRCSTCGEPKARTEFYAAHGNRDGLQARCKACEKQRDSATKRSPRVAFDSRREHGRTAGLDVFDHERRERIRIAAIVHDTPSASDYRGVTGGMLLAGYVR